ncbi:hypothetical protein V6N11_001451 [Hibiscus sabdariffa]|uniref:Uncharacterized protein n=1 Tax=Hibiscus sabdariffa TaxID=183260 RepID=A0ABR2RZU4_9ROSI
MIQGIKPFKGYIARAFSKHDDDTKEEARKMGHFTKEHDVSSEGVHGTTPLKRYISCAYSKRYDEPSQETQLCIKWCEDSNKNTYPYSKGHNVSNQYQEGV